MYTSWQHLIVHNETELHDKRRIKKLIRASGTIGYFGVLAFAVAGIASLIFAGFFIFQGVEYQSYKVSMFAASVVMIALASLFFVGTRMFLQEVKINPLRNFAQNPNDFEFVEGTLESSTYVPGQSRRQDHMVVVGKAYSSTGAELYVREQFSTRIWNFINNGAEESLKKGDDWYDQKGKRKTLPVPAYFIYPKRDPTVAALVGIDAKYISTK
ncbi:hypothetical protein [Bdellovibrio sp. HCB337]|uniref:hypothetical protein n=1 Tax=Bdellovibrio sp. HCB337 TaxID=3394358 RepID=UPI0039A729B8